VGAANLCSAGVTVVIATEGGPDLLAAYDLAFRLRRFDCRAIGFLGRGVCGRIHPEALPGFSGKRIRVVPHADADTGGFASATCWGQQFMSAGADVDILDIAKVVRAPGKAIKDLNDLVGLCGDRVELLAPLIP
jgi:hypothetical protein